MVHIRSVQRLAVQRRAAVRGRPSASTACWTAALGVAWAPIRLPSLFDEIVALKVEACQGFVLRGHQFRTERRLVGFRVEMFEPAKCEELRATAVTSGQRSKTFDVAELI